VESPSMAEVGAPVILSLGVAGYCSVLRPRQRSSESRGRESLEREARQ
jgi:hypothetical protein